jgi:hypothetical protein
LSSEKKAKKNPQAFGLGILNGRENDDLYTQTIIENTSQTSHAKGEVPSPMQELLTKPLVNLLESNLYIQLPCRYRY